MAVYNSSHTGSEHDEYTLKSQIVNLIYPVGALYLSLNSTNPSILFGGTWVQIEDAFLVAGGQTYGPGTTGGSATHVHMTANHTLTLAEAPAHTHGRGTMEIKGQWKIKGDSGNAGVDAPATASGAFSAINETGSGSSVASSSWNCGTGFNFTASNNWTGATDSKGGGGGHNHGNTEAGSSLPPYLSIYVWQRTA